MARLLLKDAELVPPVPVADPATVLPSGAQSKSDDKLNSAANSQKCEFSRIPTMRVGLRCV